ncbi:FAD synthase-like isoform X2 [Liolophura sinensis]|uniref:FAD synthase-like isoform X2 n=1 Tax=Liolophura sinensis TaxID=3198878 RepID=UPI0031594198
MGINLVPVGNGKTSSDCIELDMYCWLDFLHWSYYTIMIGDEILKGQTQDTNSHFLCRHLFTLGVKVKKISVIGDDLETISDEIVKFSQQYTHVITSGGIGPTHDDLTFEGLSQAFGEPLFHHPELVKVCRKFFGTDDIKSPKLKLAYVPRSAKLLYGVHPQTGEKARYPLVNVRNVYVFPGIPSLMERAFLMLQDIFKNPEAETHTEEVYVNQDEVSITHVLNQVDQQFRKNVILGSYPEFHNSYYKVKLTMESESSQYLKEAHDFLTTTLPKGSVVSYEKDPIRKSTEQVYDIVNSEDQSQFSQRVRHSVRVVEECLERYRLEEICVGFNGGKDCTVLLHVFYAVVKKKYPDFQGKLNSLYIQSKSPFPEVLQFIQTSKDSYNLNQLSFEGRIKECLGQLQQLHPEIKAVLMGTRETDPYSSHLDAFSMTDQDWPQYMRVNPLLQWGYQDVWKFLRDLSLPYCKLYDRGYTSLGSMDNTHPNPSLQYIDSHGVLRYKPAYQLSEDHRERDGRN